MSHSNLLDSTPDELVTLVEGWGEPGYRGRQLASWVYAKGVRDSSVMSNLPRSLRERLARETVVAPPEVAERLPSRDGSTKLVLRLALRSLARHYGLSAVARGGDGGKVRHWGAEDYRPRID